jgi:hypothetical protein
MAETTGVTANLNLTPPGTNAFPKQSLLGGGAILDRLSGNNSARTEVSRQRAVVSAAKVCI